MTTKLNVPRAVGVPAITPVLALRASPGGKEPEEMLQAYGGTPPEAPNVWLYELSLINVPGRLFVVIIRSVELAIVIENVAVAAL